MTLQEVAAFLGKSEVTIKKNFVRTQEALARKGIILIKYGRGKNTTYEVEFLDLDLDLEKE